MDGVVVFLVLGVLGVLGVLVVLVVLGALGALGALGTLVTLCYPCFANTSDLFVNCSSVCVLLTCSVFPVVKLNSMNSSLWWIN